MGYPSIALPSELEGLQLIASVSGGKDSTALMLALRENGLPFKAVFADTGWEAPETYAYLDLLRTHIGPIDVVGVEGGMETKVRARKAFPSRVARWCTEELKMQPLRKYHDVIEATGIETVNVVGVRASESAARAVLSELEDEPIGHRSWGGWVWRPLLQWTIADVLKIHNAHQVPVNPLYQKGMDRVGCYPCIYANKEQVKALVMTDPKRIEYIAGLEAELTASRDDGASVTFFQSRNGARGIEEVATWSRTSRGGKQLPLLDDPPRGGCMRWGLCDMPAEPSDED